MSVGLKTYVGIKRVNKIAEKLEERNESTLL